MIHCARQYRSRSKGGYEQGLHVHCMISLAFPPDHSCPLLCMASLCQPCASPCRSAAVFLRSVMFGVTQSQACGARQAPIPCTTAPQGCSRSTPAITSTACTGLVACQTRCPFGWRSMSQSGVGRQAHELFFCLGWVMAQLLALQRAALDRRGHSLPRGRTRHRNKL